MLQYLVLLPLLVRSGGGERSLKWVVVRSSRCGLCVCLAAPRQRWFACFAMRYAKRSCNEQNFLDDEIDMENQDLIAIIGGSGSLSEPELDYPKKFADTLLNCYYPAYCVLCSCIGVGLYF